VQESTAREVSSDFELFASSCLVGSARSGRSRQPDTFGTWRNRSLVVFGMTPRASVVARRYRFSVTSDASLVPLLDRIDIHIDVPAVRFRDLTGDPAPGTEGSTEIRDRVIQARERQRARFSGEKIFANSAMTPRMIRHFCRIDAESEQMLERAMTRLGLSARAYDRILKVSRTIADLEGLRKHSLTTRRRGCWLPLARSHLLDLTGALRVLL
jgi:hypothetical protein